MSVSRKLVYGIIPLALAYYYYTSDRFDPASVSGKRVLVTGASAGIGEHVAYQYARLGANLVITARRADLLEKVAKKCLELGAKEVHFVPADMSSSVERAKLVSETEKLLGGLDFLILNHAAYNYAWWNSGQDRMELLTRLMEINFMAYVDITSRFLQTLTLSGGHVGVVSSVAGKIGSVAFSHYSATKHALQGFYSSLRQELKYQKKNVFITLIVYGPVVSEGTTKMSEVEDLNGGIRIEDVGATAEDAAEVLVRGVSNKEYEVYFPLVAKVLHWVIRIFPEWSEDLMSWPMSFYLSNEPEKFNRLISKIY